MMETIIMKLDIKVTRLKIMFWSKVARYAGEKALESIKELDELMDETRICYPELIEMKQ